MDEKAKKLTMRALNGSVDGGGVGLLAVECLKHFAWQRLEECVGHLQFGRGDPDTRVRRDFRRMRTCVVHKDRPLEKAIRTHMEKFGQLVCRLFADRAMPGDHLAHICVLAFVWAVLRD